MSKKEYIFALLQSLQELLHFTIDKVYMSCHMLQLVMFTRAATFYILQTLQFNNLQNLQELPHFTI